MKFLTEGTESLEIADWSFLEGAPRERELLVLAAEGKTDKEIAAMLGLSPETIASYWKRIRLRLNVASRTAAVAAALETIRRHQQLAAAQQLSLLEEELREKRATESELQEALETLRGMLQGLRTAVLLEDVQHRVSFVNHAFLELFRIPQTPSDLLGLESRELFPQTVGTFVEPEASLARIRSILAEGKPVHRETVRLADGRSLLRDYLPLAVGGRLIGHFWQLEEACEQPSSYRQAVLDAEFAQAVAEAVLKIAFRGESGIQDALEAVGRAADVDRAYLFRLDEDGDRMSNTHEWVAPGVTPEKDHLQRMPVSIFPWWMEELRSGRAIAIRSLDELPPEAGAERAILEPQGILSLAAVPIARGSDVLGFLGLDSVRRPREFSKRVVDSLKILAKAIASAAG
ncbi:MAG: LuxR C-terminal-related transcriptional regulator [Fimbriimonadales bacterium]|nr:LuxR C-terminal-related transcriptional regulator [Fimbriimonadales bacterium]